jgi:hypothetical protein
MPNSNHADQSPSPGARIFKDITSGIAELLATAERDGGPLELDPYRSKLFDLFVMADATGFLVEGAEFDLTCDGVARELAVRWDLARRLASEGDQAKTPDPEQLKRLKLLRSFIGLWHEWTYAWQRWSEFHEPS